MIIKSHNARLLNKRNGNRKACSCRNKSQCPLDGNCLQTSLVYEAEVITEAEKFRYIGLCEGNFKLDLTRISQPSETENTATVLNSQKESGH